MTPEHIKLQEIGVRQARDGRGNFFRPAIGGRMTACETHAKVHPLRPSFHENFNRHLYLSSETSRGVKKWSHHD
jgi:hypothetical protein